MSWKARRVRKAHAQDARPNTAEPAPEPVVRHGNPGIKAVELQKVITRIVEVPGPRGERGERGEPGPAGEQGPPGESVSEAVIKALVSRDEAHADLLRRVDELERVLHRS